MVLIVNSHLAGFYNVIDKTSKEKLHEVQYVDDKKGVYHTYKLENKHRNIGIRMINGEYVTFIKQGNIELVGKNIWFRLLKKVIDKFNK